MQRCHQHTRGPHLVPKDDPRPSQADSATVREEMRGCRQKSPFFPPVPSPERLLVVSVVTFLSLVLNAGCHQGCLAPMLPPARTHVGPARWMWSPSPAFFVTPATRPPVSTGPPGKLAKSKADGSSPVLALTLGKWIKHPKASSWRISLPGCG